MSECTPPFYHPLARESLKLLEGVYFALVPRHHHNENVTTITHTTNAMRKGRRKGRRKTDGRGSGSTAHKEGCDTAHR